MKGKNNLIIYFSLYTGTVHGKNKTKEFFDFFKFFWRFVFKKMIEFAT
jgi:hypothetical protein